MLSLLAPIHKQRAMRLEQKHLLLKTQDATLDCRSEMSSLCELSLTNQLFFYLNSRCWFESISVTCVVLYECLRNH